MRDGESALDERERRVAEALERHSPKLAGLYVLALEILSVPRSGGRETALISVISHCMREIMMGLPAALAVSAIPRPSPSSVALVAKLPELLAAHSDFEFPSGDEDGQEREMERIHVPRAVVVAIGELVSTSVREQGRNRQNAAELLTGGDDTKHPALRHWKESYDFFVGWAHLDRNHLVGRTPPTNEEIRSHIRVVESVVELRTAAFFDNLRAVEALLSEINGPEGGKQS